MQGIITKQLGPLSFLVEVEKGMIWKRHVDQLRDGIPSTNDHHPGDSSPPTTNGDVDTFMHPSPSRLTTTNSTSKRDSTQTSQRYPTRVRQPPDRLM